MAIQDQSTASQIPLQHLTCPGWLEVGLWFYLAVILGIYLSGAALAAQLGAWLGPMPVRGGLWTWAWSVDRVGSREGLWLAGLTLLGAVTASVVSWRSRSGLPARASPTLPVLVLAGLALAAALTMWYFRVGVSLGDGFNYMFMLRFKRWFIMSQPLSTALLAAGHAVLARVGWPTVPSAAVVICLAGAVWVFTLFKLSAQLRPWPSLLLLVVGLLTGGSAIFFGYLESTPIALASALVYFYLARQVLVKPAPVWPAALALGITIAMHGQMLYLGLSFAVLMLTLWRRGERHTLAVAALLALLPGAAVAGFALTHPALIEGKLYGDALGGGDGRMFVPLLKPSTYAEFYTLFSFNYFTELANLILRTTPMLGALVLPAAWAAWQTRRTALTQWLVAVIVGAAALVVFWNPDLGMPHDWELFAPALMLMLVACVCLWPDGWQPRLGAAWLGAAAGFGIAALWVTLSYFVPVGSWDVWTTPWIRPEHRTEVRFGERIDLLGHSLLQPQYAPGETLTVQLFWRPRAVLPVDYTAGVYLIQTNGASATVLAQDDHRPEAPVPYPDRRYSSLWVVGEVVPDTHTIVIPAETLSGSYEVWLALYDLQTNTRLPVSSAEGESVLKLLPITIE